MYAYKQGVDVVLTDSRPVDYECIEVNEIPQKPSGSHIWDIVDGALVWVPAEPTEPETPTDPLTITQLAVAELAQAVEDNNTATQLAIAELAESILGGAT